MSGREVCRAAGPCEAMRPPLTDRPAGFTLVEIVLIIVIAAVAILPLSMLFANTSIRSGDARNATIAAQLAQAKMEELTADKNSPTRGFSYLIAANYPAESPVTAFPGYSRTVAFAPDSIYDGVTFRTVGVTVVCPNIPPVTLTTWFTNY
jgi:type II secretory pathway pseudopilin PulG